MDAAAEPAGPGADSVLPGARLVGAMPRTVTSSALAQVAALATAWADEQGAGAEAVALGERSVDQHTRAAGDDAPPPAGPGGCWPTCTSGRVTRPGPCRCSSGNWRWPGPRRRPAAKVPTTGWPSAACKPNWPCWWPIGATPAGPPSWPGRRSRPLAPALGEDHPEVTAAARLRDDNRATAERGAGPGRPLDDGEADAGLRPGAEPAPATEAEAEPAEAPEPGAEAAGDEAEWRWPHWSPSWRRSVVGRSLQPGGDCGPPPHGPRPRGERSHDEAVGLLGVVSDSERLLGQTTSPP